MLYLFLYKIHEIYKCYSYNSYKKRIINPWIIGFIPTFFISRYLVFKPCAIAPTIKNLEISFNFVYKSTLIKPSELNITIIKNPIIKNGTIENTENFFSSKFWPIFYFYPMVYHPKYQYNRDYWMCSCEFYHCCKVTSCIWISKSCSNYTWSITVQLLLSKGRRPYHKAPLPYP